MKIAPFRIEQYFAVHEFTAPHLLSSSDAETVAIADVLALEPNAADRLFAQQLRYTESAGAPELRAAASAIYKTTEGQDIVVVSAAEEHVGSGGVDQWVDEVCNHGVRISPSTGPPVKESVAVAGIFDRGQLVIEPWLDDPMPDDDCNPPLWQL